MTLSKKLHPADIENVEHNDVAEAKQILLIAKTTSGEYIPITLTDEGKLG